MILKSLIYAETENNVNRNINKTAFQHRHIFRSPFLLKKHLKTMKAFFFSKKLFLFQFLQFLQSSETSDFLQKIITEVKKHFQK